MPAVTVRLKNDTRSILRLHSAHSNGGFDAAPSKSIALGQLASFTLQASDQPLECALSYHSEAVGQVATLRFVVQEDDINTRVNVIRGYHADVETLGEFPSFCLNVSIS